MAKKTVQEKETNWQDGEIDLTKTVGEFKEFPTIAYEDLITAKVRVMDKHGNTYYLDPLRRPGEFGLRVIPQPKEETSAELPPEWRKPTKAEVEAAEGKIDWKRE